ncbi:MAG: recombinase family protein [Clostridia bacterium]|nr:recombinase family protein [Clostridia bacterium]
MIYGYARVSTVKQMKEGTSLQDQVNRLTAEGAQEIFKDSYTGTKTDRPEFSKLQSKLQSGDTLIVTKLDRFARTAADGAKLIQELVNRGVTVHVLNMGQADNTPMGKLMITILLAFAEFERDMIVERTQAGKAAARAQGQRVDGRPKKYPPAQMNHALDLLTNGSSYSHVERLTGISKSTLIREMRKRKAAELEGDTPKS